MRRLWGLVGGLAKPLRLALLLLLSGHPLTGLLIRMRKVVMMGIMIFHDIYMIDGRQEFQKYLFFVQNVAILFTNNQFFRYSIKTSILKGDNLSNSM